MTGLVSTNSIEATTLTPLILGGAVSMVQLAVMGILLLTTTGLYKAMKSEFGGSKALGIAGVMYAFEVVWVLAWL
jgi:hypothetical protein